jgi:hypothetical protein
MAIRHRQGNVISFKITFREGSGEHFGVSDASEEKF